MSDTGSSASHCSLFIPLHFPVTRFWHLFALLFLTPKEIRKFRSGNHMSKKNQGSTTVVSYPLRGAVSRFAERLSVINYQLSAFGTPAVAL